MSPYMCSSSVPGSVSDSEEANHSTRSWRPRRTQLRGSQQLRKGQATSSGARLAYAESLNSEEASKLQKELHSGPEGRSSGGADNSVRSQPPRVAHAHLGMQCLQAEECAYGRDMCRTV
ncbi:hypothetical protein E4U19_005097 [Claviceps sp. Clav32 group G5]|nr:hypothetical protein E4U19_005097 [Claviceps sp. Clav32 group G5]